MGWHARRLAAFDIETTGVDCDRDRIVAAALTILDGRRPVERHTWLVDPGVAIPAEATAVHRITTAQARRHGVAPAAVIDAIVLLLARQMGAGVPVVAFNARFDLTLLDREARRHGIPSLADRLGGPERLLVVDPYVLDRHLDPDRPGKRTLGAVCEHYGVPLHDPHVAGADALAAALVARRLGEAFPQLRRTGLRALHLAQVGWAAEQAEALREHHAREGHAAVVDTAWPVVPARAVPALLAA